MKRIFTLIFLTGFTAKADQSDYWEAIFEASNNARIRAHDVHLPISAPKSSSFGLRFHPILNTNRLHRGTDYAANEGTPFRAAASGTVQYVETRGDLGLTIAIKHNDGVVSRYGHASESLVQPGDIVDKGQAIGLVGSTGKVTGPHLHFEMLINGVHVDPEEIKSLYNPDLEESTLSERIEQLLSAQQIDTLLSSTHKEIRSGGVAVSEPGSSSSQKLMTLPSRTTWSIASDLIHGTDLTIYQSLYAIVDANPQAFPSGDINLRYADQKLELPTPQIISKQCPHESKDRFYGKLSIEIAKTEHAD